MNKMSIRKDDTVIVLSGKDKGKQGKVLEVMPKEGKVVVEKINVVSRHTKPAGRAGRHHQEGSPHLRLQGAARLPQVQQAHPARSQAAGRRQEGPHLQEVRRRDLREEEYRQWLIRKCPT